MLDSSERPYPEHDKNLENFNNSYFLDIFFPLPQNEILRSLLDEATRTALSSKFSLVVDSFYTVKIKPHASKTYRPQSLSLSIRNNDQQVQSLRVSVQKNKQLQHHIIVFNLASEFYALLDYFKNFKQYLGNKISEYKKKKLNDEAINEELAFEAQIFEQNVAKVQTLMEQVKQLSPPPLSEPLSRPVSQAKVVDQINTPVSNKPNAARSKQEEEEIIETMTSGFIIEPDTAPMTLIKPTQIQRLVRYIKSNPWKIVGSFLLGAAGVAALAFFWPVIVPTFLATALGTVGAMVVMSVMGGSISTLITSAAHYKLSEKTRKSVNAKICVLASTQASIASSDENTNQDLGLDEENTVSSAQTQEEVLDEKPDLKSHFTNFFELLNISIPALTLRTQTLEQIIGLLRTSIANLKTIDPTILVKKFLLKKKFQNVTIDFTLIQNYVSDSRLHSFDLQKKLDLKTMALHSRFLKMQVVTQILNDGKADLEHLEDFTLIGEEKLRAIYSRISSEHLIKTYCKLSSKDPAQAKMLKALCCELTPNMQPLFNQPISKRKKIIELFLSFFPPTNIAGNSAFENLAHILKTRSGDEIADIYFFMHYNKLQEDDSLFLEELLRECFESLPTEKQKFEITLSQKQISDEALISYMTLFIKHAKPELQIKKLSKKQIIDHFYKQLATLSHTNVVKFFSQIRFYAFLEPSKTKQFADVIRSFYKHDPQKLRAVNDEFKELQKPKYFEVNVVPITNEIKLFIKRFSNEQDIDLTNITVTNLLAHFYRLLESLHPKLIVSYATELHILKEKDNIPRDDSPNVRFLFKLIKNFFEIKRPDAFDLISTKGLDRLKSLSLLFKEREKRITFFKKRCDVEQPSNDFSRQASPEITVKN